jgi:hypothetical protein
MIVQEPLFASAHNALLFAFNFSGQQYDRPIMNRLPDGPIDYVSKGLSGMDGAAQAGMVFNKLFHLPPLYQYIVFAAYAPRTIPCECRRSCCVGQKRNEQWHACIRMIEEAAITQALPGCITHRVLRRGIVQRAFGDKSVVLLDLAEKAGVNKNTATDHNSKVRLWLHGQAAGKNRPAILGVKTQALQMIEKILVEDGLVNY